jgi:DNA-directed RNA polymerase subunit K/omega
MGNTFKAYFARSMYLGELMTRFTRFEITRVLSARALQLSLGAPPLVKRTSELSMLEVAEKELLQKVLPLSILRKFPNGNHKRVELY